MAPAMEASKHLYNIDNPGINWLRNTGMRFVNDNKSLKAVMTKFAGAWVKLPALNHLLAR
jgi:hypothetical protein